MHKTRRISRDSVLIGLRSALELSFRYWKSGRISQNLAFDFAVMYYSINASGITNTIFKEAGAREFLVYIALTRDNFAANHWLDRGGRGAIKLVSWKSANDNDWVWKTRCARYVAYRVIHAIQSYMPSVGDTWLLR